MTASPEAHVTQCNGREATVERLSPLSFAGYAHFTAMQVSGGRVRGLDLHLERLRLASHEMFGQALPDDEIRRYLRTAIAAGPDDLSLVVTVYSPAGEFTVAGPEVTLEVLVRTSPPSSGPQGPLRLATYEYERTLPAVKHVGELAKTYFLRRAAEQGFDDAAFVDRMGRFSEGTIWNLAFWDGEAVIWPQAEKLYGTTMGILRRQLDRLGIPQRDRIVTSADLPILAGAVVMNSWTPGIAASRIGDVPMPQAAAFVELLHEAYRAEPLETP